MSGYTKENVVQYYNKLKTQAEKSGYLLNPDLDFTMGIAESLLINEQRYGYPLCPCRLSGGSREADLDIICPCDYRDPDLADYGRCYCALYVSPTVTEEQLDGPIPERRPSKEKRQAPQKENVENDIVIWRCKVCGYLCARPQPPEVCPICGASKDRFERFNPK
jgi:ferredoxin-thioredoxin reductase catalytic subunit